jgi:glycosyltransferase involved in cell wall biosynthesis
VAIFVPLPEAMAPDSVLLQPVVEKGVRVYRVPVGMRSPAKIFLQTFRQPQLRRNWQRVLDSEQPDLVHIEHLMGLPFSLVSDLRERGIPYVVTLHDYWYVCANAQLLTNTEQEVCTGPDARALNCARCALARTGLNTGLGGAFLLSPMMTLRNNQAAAVLQDAAQIIAPTRFVHDLYLSLLPGLGEIEVLPHGIEPPKKVVEKAPVDQRVNSRDGRLHVGYIGSIAKQKGVHVLISAVNALPGQDILLTIYGNLASFPEYVAELRTLITRPGIEMRGSLDHEAIWSAIAEFDVVVIPTLWYETSVLVVDEVLAAGVPLIGSNIGVLPEKIKNGENGRLFEAGNADELKGILAELTSKPQTLMDWRQHIDPVFTIDDHISRLEEIYAHALNPV